MKIRLNIIQLLALGVLAAPIAFSSCSEDKMDAINKNPNNPTDVQAKFILADVITSTGFRNVGGDFNTYLSTYVEHEVGVHNQLWNAEHRVNEPSASSTFNNSWNNIYETIRNARIVSQKCAVGGPQAGNNTTLGMAQILEAYNLALLTDMYGDVPYSEAFNPLGNKTPKIDKQEELYKTVFELLDAAIENLPKGDKHVSGTAASHDLLYNGNATKWMEFAYGLKARYTMRLLKVSNDQQAALNKVIEFADKSFQSAASEAAFNIYGPQNLNPLFDFQWSRAGLAASKSIADKFISLNDPRLNRVFVDQDLEQVADIQTGNDSYKLLAENGENQQTTTFYSTNMFGYAQTASTQFLSLHEVLFLKAEAMQRLGRSTAQITPVLAAAVKAGIQNAENSVKAALTSPTLANYGGITENSKAITAAEAEAYFDAVVKPLFEGSPLKEIANQKYLASFGASGESTEAYNDIRRWKALGENLIELKNTKKFPLRLPYGSSETTANPNVESAYGDGQYVYSENVWWAGGTR